MPTAIDYNEPAHAERAAAILRRHERVEPEANITSAVRGFLIGAGLAQADEIVEVTELVVQLPLEPVRAEAQDA